MLLDCDITANALLLCGVTQTCAGIVDKEAEG